MPSPREVAEQHQRSVIARTDATSRRVLREWRKVDVAQLDASWDAVGPVIAAAVATAQSQNAAAAGAYAGAVDAALDVTEAAVRVNPAAVSGVDGSSPAPPTSQQ